MNKEMCDEIIEEFEYFREKYYNTEVSYHLTVALQIRKLSSSKKR